MLLPYAQPLPPSYPPKNATSINQFIQSLAGRYTTYFNKKHHRVGKLFQGPYKAIRIDSDEYLIYLSSYIHRNPQSIHPDLQSAYSSYSDYVGNRTTPWVNTRIILDYFSELSTHPPHQAYQEFTQTTDPSPKLGDLTLEQPLKVTP